MRSWLEAAAEQTGGPNSRDIAALVHLAVREISRMQARQTGSDLLHHFKQFRKQALQNMGGRSDYFSMLLQLSIAQGAIDLNQTASGLAALSTVMKKLRQADCITLDLVDISAAAIQVLESADLTQRSSGLESLLAALVEQSNKLDDLASTANLLSMLRLLDQLCEASVSKDRITLGRYRRYQDLDELQIRERILTEDHCL